MYGFPQLSRACTCCTAVHVRARNVHCKRWHTTRCEYHWPCPNSYNSCTTHYTRVGHSPSLFIIYSWRHQMCVRLHASYHPGKAYLFLYLQCTLKSAYITVLVIITIYMYMYYMNATHLLKYWFSTRILLKALKSSDNSRLVSGIIVSSLTYSKKCTIMST